MKKSFLFALTLAALSCAPGADKLQSGDLIFVGIPVDYSLEEGSAAEAISASTGGGELNLIHVAIADVAPDGAYVIDATMARGVDRHPLDTFLMDFTLKDGSMPVFIVKRLKKGVEAPGCVQNAIGFCGEAYDNAFLEGNGAHYCSELVRDSYLAPDGSCIFPNAPMNWKDSSGEIPLYWTQLFALLGMEVPQGEPGTNPQDMAGSPLLEDTGVSIL